MDQNLMVSLAPEVQEFLSLFSNIRGKEIFNSCIQAFSDIFPLLFANLQIGNSRNF